MTIQEIVERMEAGEKLRWIADSELTGEEDEDCDQRRLYIGGDAVPEKLHVDVMRCSAIRELPGNEDNQAAYIDFELVT